MWGHHASGWQGCDRGVMHSAWKVRRRWPKRACLSLPKAFFPSAVILDTNILLDLWLNGEEPSDHIRPLHAALHDKTAHWLATQAMRTELERVLAYPHIAARLAGSAERLLGHFDALAQLVPAAARAPFRCRDADDQKFVDLAAAHPGAQLISHDREVLALRSQMARLGVAVGESFPARTPTVVSI